MKEKLVIIKIGGHVIDQEASLQKFLKDYAAIDGPKILVHGGGKMATALSAQLGIPQQLINGRRITDEATLRIVTMVYAGLINKSIVAGLQANRCNAFGICGADGDAIRAHKRINAVQDFGFAGDIDQVNTGSLQCLLQQYDALVVAPITHDGNGQLLNTNADTIAQELAQALSIYYETSLIYCFEQKGVLADIERQDSVVRKITPGLMEEMKANGSVHSGMLPKLENACSALQKGVSKVIIGKWDELNLLIQNQSGTEISHD